MAEIKRLGIDNKIQDAIKEKPILAICVGMQALMEQSEENHGVQCIGLFDGIVKLFGDPLLDSENNIMKVPHMGWNQVRQTKVTHSGGISLTTVDSILCIVTMSRQTILKKSQV